MKNLVTAFEAYSDFVIGQKENHSAKFYKVCLADAVISYWRMLLFMDADDEDFDDAAKAEEELVDSINTFTAGEKVALKKAAQARLKQLFPRQESIDPEDESLNREQRFLTFIATGRCEDMYLL